jgi:hypothetical protein
MAMAEDSAPWRAPHKWAKFCEMARELLTAADDIAAGVVDDSHEATIVTRWPADEISVGMNTLADLLEANAKFLREVAGIKREDVSDEEQ